MIDLDLGELRRGFGFGVAGNFAGHLEQAGEAADFAAVEAASAEAPKGIFPWYVPGDDGFLGVFPLSHDRLSLPSQDEPTDLQIEPEAGVLMRVSYSDAGAVTDIAPVALGAFNDCSIRRAGAPKISVKKNWGPDSKGVARRLFPIADLDPAGDTATFRLASFLRRDGAAGEYGVDSPLPGYSYYGARLLDWIVERLGNQRGGEGTPLEPVGEYLDGCGRPATVLVGIGATRYTPLGESTYLRAGDESVVVVYDAARTSPDDVRRAVAAGAEDDLRSASVLRQVVRAG
ncbi:MAG: DUF5718 family protein [Thermoleophilia bacterium]